jgi:DNA-binding FadR family transcriptional regulator
MIFHEQLATLTGNAVIEFFVQLLARLSALATLGGAGRPTGDGRRAWVEAHAGIVEAVIAGDSGLARQRMDLHLAALGDALTARVGGDGRLPAELSVRDRAAKRAEVLAAEIYRDVAASGWDVGTHLGSEAELIERYGGSLGTVGEAARLLEHHGIASMRRGPGGGLFVTRPGISAVTSAMAAWLEYRGATRAQLHEAGRGLDLASVEDAARTANDDTVRGLRDELARTDRTQAEYVDGQGRNFHVLVAELSGNPVLAVLMRVLVLVTIDLTPRTPKRREARQGSSPAHRQHQAIVDAIEARDPAVARRRMLRHLEALDRP